MALTEDEQREIREEEYFRLEVRRQLGEATTSASRWTRFASIFETKVGYWLLTTVLAGSFAGGFTYLQRFLDRDELARREAAELDRRDIETILKFGPMLSADKPSDRSLAFVLLDGLGTGRNGGSPLGTKVKSIFETKIRAGASPEERASAETIFLIGEPTRLPVATDAASASGLPDIPSGASGAAVLAAPSNPSVLATIPPKTLPVRIYVQVSTSEDAQRASSTSAKLRNSGLLVPGVEIVPAAGSPRQHQLRYCKGKAAPETVAQVLAAVTAALPQAPSTLELPANLCGKVRWNHFELWYPRPA